MCKWVCFFVLAILFIGGCGGGESSGKFSPEEIAVLAQPQSDNLPAVSGGMVLAVSGETITSDQIIKTTIDQLRPLAQSKMFGQFVKQADPYINQVVAAKITDILLYKEARRQAGEQIDDVLEKEANKEVKKFIVRLHGDYAQAEEALKEMSMDWESFAEFQKKRIMSQYYLSTQLKDEKPITYSELKGYYDRVKDKQFSTKSQITLRLIDIEISKVKVPDPNQDRAEYAKSLADELFRRLQSGEDFGKLAEQYSNGYRASLGGLWDSRNPESLAKPYDILAIEAEKIEAGQIARPILTEGHIFIMKLEEKQSKSFEPFAAVQEKIEAAIMIERQKKAFDKFLNELVRQAEIGNKQIFIDYCLNKVYQMSN